MQDVAFYHPDVGLKAFCYRAATLLLRLSIDTLTSELEGSNAAGIDIVLDNASAT